jgi:Uma2 family endonuclease
MTVRIGDDTAYEPDVVVHCGPDTPPDATFVANPVIVVEVLSPSTRTLNMTVRLVNYFTVASMSHVLFLDSQAGRAALHSRSGAHGWTTRMVAPDELLHLDPPGVRLEMGAVFAAG